MAEYPVLDLRTQLPARGHYVYRFYDSAGALLYIGSTINFWRRVGDHIHQHENEWWPEVSWERTLVEIVGAEACPGRPCPLPGHADMVRREKELVASLQPRYNLNLTGYCRRGLHLLSEHSLKRQSGVIGCYTCQLERMRASYSAAKRQALADAGQLTFPE